MIKLFSCLKMLTKPREFYRSRFKLPLIRFVYGTAELYKRRTKTGVNNIREVIFRGTIVALSTATLVWLSIFMYVAFYYAYVPTILHEHPVYLQFRPCESEKGICSFPSAHIQLTKRQQLLMLGQPYKVHLDLDMPESPVNKDLGMFMVCADFQGNDKKLLASSCRSAMLHYRSALLEFIYKIFFSPFFVLGTSEEKQQLHIELFTDYQEHESQAVTDVYLEIQTKYIEIYSAKFLINAQFSGLRYIMFHWPLLSAAIGITSNLFFIALVCMVSWYQIIHSEEYKDYIKKKELLDGNELDLDGDSSSSFEEASLLEESEPGNIRKRNLEEREFLEDVPSM